MTAQATELAISSARPSRGRRAIDIVLTAPLLVLVCPVLAVLVLAVRLSSPGPALYRQRRIGEGGREFTLLKLRSMRVGSAGPQVTAAHDVRITPVGRFLRRTSLDELPQLLNVLRGDMTLVGPRPETPALAARYPATCRWVFAHRPGMTGPCQIRLRDDAVLPAGIEDAERYYLDVLVPQRVQLDATFLSAPTVANAVRILAATARYLVVGTAD